MTVDRITGQVIPLITFDDFKAVGGIAQFVQAAAKTVHAATMKFHIAGDDEQFSLSVDGKVHQPGCNAPALNLVLPDETQAGRLRDIGIVGCDCDTALGDACDFGLQNQIIGCIENQTAYILCQQRFTAFDVLFIGAAAQFFDDKADFMCTQ